MKLDSLEKLYIHELKDLYSAESQLVKALPKMVKAATDSELKEAFSTHLEETKTHLDRLKSIFEGLEVKPGRHKCTGMEGMIAECESLIDSESDRQVLDAGLVSAAQRAEHYEIAAYGTARTYAAKLGRQDEAKILQETLNEEGACNELLTQLAEQRLNSLAMATEHAE